MPKVEMQRLGDYIREVDVRNKDLKVTKLMGVNIGKFFMPSVANVIGTDLSNYKVVYKGQFASNLMHVGRDEKIPIAMYELEEPIIVSPAYFVFEVIDIDIFLPSYLMMWLQRTDFDRQACFFTDGDVRGGLSKDAFLNMTLPIPPIARQREIVAEYAMLANRIRLNNRLISTLESTAQALYRKMFVEGIDKDHLPNGWRMGTLTEVINCFDYKRRPLAGYDRADMAKKYPYYGAAALMDYVDDYMFDGTYILMGEDGTVINADNTPVIQYVTGKFWVNNHAHVLKGMNGFDENLLYLILKNTQINEYVTGGVQAKINQENMMSIPVLIPTQKELEVITKNIQPIFQLFLTKHKENEKLTKLQSLLLAKMGG